MRKFIATFIILLMPLFSFADSHCEDQREFDSASNWAKQLSKSPSESDLSYIKNIEENFTDKPKEASWNVSKLDQEAEATKTHKMRKLAEESNQKMAAQATMLDEKWLEGKGGIGLKAIEDPESVIALSYEDCKKEPILSSPILEERNVRCKEATELFDLDCTQTLIIQTNADYKLKHITLISERFFPDIMGVESWPYGPYGRQFIMPGGKKIHHKSKKSQGRERVGFNHERFNHEGRYLLDGALMIFSSNLVPTQSALKQIVSRATGIDVMALSDVLIEKPLDGFAHLFCDASGCRNVRGYIKLSYKQKSVKIIGEYWQGNCKALEDYTDQGVCFSKQPRCTHGPETRIIKGIPVHRDCWQRKIDYHCGLDSKTQCPNYRKLGCEQTSERCIRKIGKHCLEYEKHYACKKRIQNPTGQYKLVCAGQPFCLNGDCLFDGYEANEDMMESIAQFQILMALQNVKDKKLSIFKGKKQTCHTNCLSYMSCCGKGAGWGKTLGASCSASEKSLAYKRGKGLCHKVGTYCSKKVLGKCIKKEQGYCCFQSKVSRIIQEQVRQQLGIQWGNPKHPKCRGLTIEELTQADWEKLDLSELYADILEQMKLPDLDQISHKANEAVVNQIQENTLKNSTQSSLILPRSKD